MFDAAPLNRRWGTVVRPRGATPVSALPRSEIIALLKTSGAVLFSGFEIDGDGFKALTESFGHAFVTNLHAGSHRDMVSDEGRTSTVNLGSPNSIRSPSWASSMSESKFVVTTRGAAPAAIMAASA